MRSEAEIRKEQLEDLRKVMGLPEGRRFILRLLDDVCGVNKSVFRSNPLCKDEERLIVNGAKQAVGHWLRDEVDLASPVAMDLMRGEANARKSMETSKPSKETKTDE